MNENNNNQTIQFPLYGLMNLKEGEKLAILNIALGKEGKRLSLHFDTENGYKQYIQPYKHKIMDCISESLNILGLEVIDNLVDGEIHYANVSLFVEEGILSYSINLFEFEDNNIEAKDTNFYKNLNYILGDIVVEVNNDFNKHVELLEEGKLFEPREFTFIYHITNNGLVYFRFGRYEDRDVNEEKRDVETLLNQGVDKKIANMLREEDFNESEVLLVRFISDGFSVAPIDITGVH